MTLKNHKSSGFFQILNSHVLPSHHTVRTYKHFQIFLKFQGQNNIRLCKT